VIGQKVDQVLHQDRLRAGGAVALEEIEVGKDEDPHIGGISFPRQ